MRKIGVLCLALFAVLACCAGSGTVNKQLLELEGEEGYVPETVPQFEKRVKKMVNSAVKMLLPYLISSVAEVKLSGPCFRGLLMVMKDVMGIREWAFRMLDAMGKPSSSILEGTSRSMGDYDECLDITAQKKFRSYSNQPSNEEDIAFHGQYCTLKFYLPPAILRAVEDYQAGNRNNSDLANSKTFLRRMIHMAPRADIADYRYGVCIPSTCSVQDLQAIADQIAKMMTMKISVLRCEKKEGKSYRLEHYIVLPIIVVIALLVTLGTTVETIIRLNSPIPIIDIMYDRGKVVRYILAFSAPNNLQNLFSTKTTNTEKITCIRGMKFLMVCLYIVLYTYANPEDSFFSKYKGVFNFFKFMEDWSFTFIANAAVGVDTVFLIAGLQVTYRLWKKSEKGNVKISIPKFILKWYIRFTSIQLIVIGLFLCLPLIGDGPIWADVVTPVANNCRERWWLNVLYISNFWPYTDTCLSHAWIFCSLMHLLLLAPIVLFILSKSTSVGIFVNVILIVGSSVAIAMVTLMNDLPPGAAFYFLNYLNLRTVWDKLFIQAYNHVAPFSVGMLLAYFLSRYDKIHMKRPVVIIGWCCGIACNASVICGLVGYRNGEPMDMPLSAFYSSVHGLVWSFGTAWLVFACAYGYGGVVDMFLSWKFFIPMERLAVGMFVFHPLVMSLHQGQLRERLYMGHMDNIMLASAYIALTIVCAIVCYITFISPFTYFEKKLWDRLDRRSFHTTMEDVPKLKRKESKPTIIEIGPSIEKTKYFGKLKWNSHVETKSFQT